MRTAIIVSVFVLVTIGIAIFIRYTSFGDQEDKNPKNSQASREGKNSQSITVSDRWEVPGVLKEISGIVYLGPDRFASVQDEIGSVYIYNTAEEKIEREIPFGKGGDYEDLAVAGNSIFVLEAGGTLHEIAGYMDQSPKIREYDGTPPDLDSEGLWFSQDSNRLLIAVKESKSKEKDLPPSVYAFNLQTRRMAKDLVYELGTDDPVFKESGGKDQGGRFKPSAIAVHPVTGEIYLLEGVKPRLLILDAAGNPRKLYRLPKDIKQPEGLAFSPDGQLYMCSEGTKKLPGTIVRLTGF
jgi:hypothetical protein